MSWNYARLKVLPEKVVNEGLAAFSKTDIKYVYNLIKIIAYLQPYLRFVLTSYLWPNYTIENDLLAH